MKVQATLRQPRGVLSLTFSGRLLLSLVVLVFMGLLYGESNAQTVIIGTETNTDRLPMNRYYNYSTYEAIYDASEIGTTGDITNIAFYKDGGSNTDPVGNVSIYMKHTMDASFEDDYYNLNDYTLVFSGSFTNDATSGWMDVALTSMFSYNGTDNLQILIVKDFEDYISSTQAPKYQYSYYDDYKARYDYSDEELPGYLYTVTERVNLRLQIVEPTPMMYQASVAFLPGGTVQRGARDAEVLGNAVIVSGSLDPLPITEFTFNTNGTTNLADLKNAKLWYSGSTSVFNTATARQFGSTIESPNGDLTFSDEMTLGPGVNFFWLTYDVASDATLLNLIDGQFTSLTVDNTLYTPFVTDPDGARKIGLVYCQSGAAYFGDEIVEAVSFGTLDNNTGGEDATYSDFSDILSPPQVVKTRTYPLSVVLGTVDGNYGGGINVFIDWNQNEIYEESERVLSEAFPDDIELPFTYSTDVIIPDDAVDGLVGMRVMVEEEGSASSEPCGLFGYGETEDYYIEIASPGTIVVEGDAVFGNVGSRKVRTVRLHNPSSVEDVMVSGWTMSGTSYQVYMAGTTTPLPANFVVATNGHMDVDVVFGVQGVSMAGQQNAALTFNHDGWKSPTVIPASGYYASLTAMDGTTNLLAPGAAFDVGGLQPGSGQVTGEFRLGSSVALPINAALNITGSTITGPDAFLFQVSTLPAGITGENIISVTLRATGAVPGPKTATLLINHGGANGPTTAIQLQGRIGQPVIAAPGIVNLPPVAIGQNYNNPYSNVALIPLTRAGAVDVQFFQTPTITGSGAGRMEILNNAGRYFVRGAYDGSGNVVVAGNGDLNVMANWVNPLLAPIQVTETQPLLLAVRMRPASAGTPAGSYDASILLSNGSGAGVSNAVNVASITVIGEVLNDPSILPFYPSQLAFGSTPIGTSVEKTLLVRNQSGVAGTAQLSITGLDYNFSNGAKSISIPLPSDNTPVSVIVRFSPMSSGAANGVISASGVISGSVALSGSGQAANPGNLQLLVDGQPLSGLLNFGNVAVGSTGSRMITVVNNNVGPVEITSIGRSGANATQFSVGTASSMTIAGNGGSVSFPVQFMPTTLSSPQKDATITVYNSTGVPKSFNVQGTASTTNGSSVSVSLSPTQYNYGNASGSHSFVLTNTGTSPVVVSGALVLGSTNFVVVDATSSFPRTISAGGSTTVNVRFNANEGVNGLRSGSLLLVTPGVTPYPTSSLTGRVGSGVSGYAGQLQSVSGTESAPMIELLGSYPNPSNGESELRYVLHSESVVRIRVYSENGAEVLSIHGGIQHTGEQRTMLKLEGLSSGRYYYEVEAGISRVSGGLILQK